MLQELTTTISFLKKYGLYLKNKSLSTKEETQDYKSIYNYNLKYLKSLLKKDLTNKK